MRSRLLAFVAMLLSGSPPLDAGASNGPRSVTVTGPSRTAWGDQDLQGVWSGLESIGVPFDREPALGTRALLTEEEFQARQMALRAAASGDNIEATNFGRGGAEGEVLRNESRQASLVVDPPDGRRPPRTAHSDARQPTFGSFSAGPFNSVSDLGVLDRCVAYAQVSVASPFNTLQIVQAPGLRRASFGSYPRDAHRASRWPIACVVQTQDVRRRFAWSMGRAAARRDDHELQRPHESSGKRWRPTERAADGCRTVHPR